MDVTRRQLVTGAAAMAAAAAVPLPALAEPALPPVQEGVAILYPLVRVSPQDMEWLARNWNPTRALPGFWSRDDARGSGFTVWPAPEVGHAARPI